MICRNERFDVEYDGVKYVLEVTEEDSESFISVEYNGTYIMDTKLEGEIIKYFNEYK